MKREPVSTDRAPAAIGPYSQAIAAAGTIVFCSGQIALPPEGGEIIQTSIQDETRQVMKNLQAVIEAAGASLASAVRCTIYLTDLGDFGKVNEVYASFFEGTPPPARACVQVSALPKGARVEIDAIAVV